LKINTKSFLILSLLWIIILSILFIAYGDYKILWAINNTHTDFLDKFNAALSGFGRGDVLVIFSLLFFIIPALRTKKYLFSSSIYGIIASLFIFELKHLIARPRPLTVFPFGNPKTSLHIVHFLDNAFEFSMPSGHTAGAFSFATFILFSYQKYLPKHAGLVLFLLAAACGISRIYLAQHFISDVIAGSFLGLLIGFISYKIGHHFFKHSEI
jgi:membrane-associated phospholipid phosphatase